MRRKPKTKKPRKRINPLSKEKAKWMRIYARQKKAFEGQVIRCSKCGMPNHRNRMEPHHPLGRHGEHLLMWVWLCSICHEAVHADGKQARALGWLQPEIEGRVCEGERHIPFHPMFCPHWSDETLVNFFKDQH